MGTIIDLKTGRYKGVEFLFTDMTTTGGNRLIKFNFPGSDKQAIERQGKAPRTFNIVIIIPSEDYYQERDNVLRVLEDGEVGVFTHPTFGDIENVTNGKYSLIEKLSRLGRGEITVPFEVDDALGVPQQSGDLASQVQAQSDALNAQLAADLTDNYKVDLGFPGNFSDALDNLNNITDAFNATSEFAEPIAENIAATRQAINVFSASIGALIQVPADLADSVAGLFEDLNNLYTAPETILGAFELLFPFGASDPEILPTTVGLTERKTNRGIIQSTIRVQALSFSYLNASERTYETTEDLDIVQASLETQYADARDTQLLTNEALEELDRLRVQAQKTLDLVRVNTRTIITVETRRIPLSVLVYSYYGDTELVTTIAELNNIKQNAFVEGTLRILTA